MGKGHVGDRGIKPERTPVGRHPEVPRQLPISDAGDRRIFEHPILQFRRGDAVQFFYDGKPVFGYTSETVAAALEANGIKGFSRSSNLHRPRGLYCAIGKCSSCLVTINGQPNMRACMTLVREGMRVESQSTGKIPEWPTKFLERPTPAAECVDVLILGAGPAGLSAAAVCSQAGLTTLVIDEAPYLGGQLVKQIHKFFGSAEEYAGTRGYEIAGVLAQQADQAGVASWRGCQLIGVERTEQGLFISDVQVSDVVQVVKAKALIVAVGAQERSLVFPGNDLPGVYGAGAIQTLVNLYGIRPGKYALIVGAGNVGLIVAYQLLQAGIHVVEVIEAKSRISGYEVHAQKIKRCGIPINCNHTILAALGSDYVEGALVAPLKEEGKPDMRGVREVEADTVCLAVGLTPSVEILRSLGVHCLWVPELGGFVPLHDPLTMATNIDGVFVAGDVSGIGEASTAILEGRLAGASAVQQVQKKPDRAVKRIARRAQARLEELRSGTTAVKALAGKKRLQEAFWTTGKR